MTPVPDMGAALPASGVALLPAVGFGVAGAPALLIGLINGILIAYATIPAIFTTLAMGLVVYGVGRGWLFQVARRGAGPDHVNGHDLDGQAGVFGVPKLPARGQRYGGAEHQKSHRE